jgi:antitoxin CptB
MTDDSDERRRRRLMYRCTHRGTREADLIFGGFAKAHLALMPPGELVRFEALMEESDPDLMTWVGGQEPPPERIDRNLIKRIYNFKIMR